ncbi:MAG: hypothetical protein JWQ14_1044 [Adhaeribacter sp.]|nr:hypothetical protein [Adhaeribacter sp.]
MVIKCTLVNKITLAVIGSLLCLGSVLTPASAQTSYSTRSTLKGETRKNKKEAAAYEADHKETHLEVANFNYKKGKAGRQPTEVEEGSTDFNNDKERNALFETRKEANKKKKLLKEQKRKRN